MVYGAPTSSLPSHKEARGCDAGRGEIWPEKMGRGRTCAPYLSMLACQVAYAASNVLCKLALQRGLSYLVLTAYRHVIAVFILGPLAYAAERFAPVQRPAGGRRKPV